jgi:hypothetical protein
MLEEEIAKLYPDAVILEIIMENGFSRIVYGGINYLKLFELMSDKLIKLTFVEVV